MPRTAEASSPEREVTPTTLDRLLARGKDQGHLSLGELREAFAEAGVSPGVGRSILRELTEAGVSLAAENEPSLSAAAATGKRVRKPATRTTAVTTTTTSALATAAVSSAAPVL